MTKQKMIVAGQILGLAIKRFDIYLEANNLTIESELERLQRNGQILGMTSIEPLSHQTTLIVSR
jgi:hypothetical protein